MVYSDNQVSYVFKKYDEEYKNISLGIYTP